MHISKKPTSVILEFFPSGYWIRENKNDPEWNGEYALTRRIDMSYKGKDDQEGPMVMFLSKEQAEIFREAGFEEISGGDADPTKP